MLTRLATLALGLALLAPLPATASLDTTPSDRAAATTKSRTVKLGHDPVRASSKDRVRLTFEGRKGQLVNLVRIAEGDTCGRRVLSRAGSGKVVEPWAPGYWRLPRTTTYTVVSKPCRNLPEQRVRLQVRRVEITERLLSGETVVAGASTSVTHLVPFRVLEHEQAFLPTSYGATALIRPDRSITEDIVFSGRDDYVVRDYPGPVRLDIPSPAGRYFVEVEPSTHQALWVESVRAATVDGPAVLMSGGSGSLVFSGDAGDWIYAELVSETGGALADPERRRALVMDVFGEPLPFVPVACPGAGQAQCQAVPLPASGTFVMRLGGSSDASAYMRVRRALRTTAATTNGGPVTYAAATPGQWVVGELPEQPRTPSGGSGVTLTVTNVSSSLTPWAVTAVSGYGQCNNAPNQPCQIITNPQPALLDDEHLTAEMPWDALTHASVAVLAVPATVTGSLDLTVTK